MLRAAAKFRSLRSSFLPVIGSDEAHVDHFNRDNHDNVKVNRSVNKVLIFRIGSIGDTVIALPAFYLIAAAFPAAERKVLTNLPVSRSGKEAPLPAVLEGSNLVHSYISYPVGFRNVSGFARLLRELRTWKPDVLIYLMPKRNLVQLMRDRIFFLLCSINRTIGLHFSAEYNRNLRVPDTTLFESEKSRLIRSIAELGTINAADPVYWNLNLNIQEITAGEEQLVKWEGKERFIACSIGTKQDVNDWGDENWSNLLQLLTTKYRDLGLLFIGSSDEYERSKRLASLWQGPSLNLCGKLSPRLSAVVSRKAGLFLGHDSGPMHLAAAVGTRCVAIFSARNKPGIWFPFGTRHKIMYPDVECFGCRLQVCDRFQKKCILSISVKRVFEEVCSVLDQNRSATMDNESGEMQLVQ